MTGFCRSGGERFQKIPKKGIIIPILGTLIDLTMTLANTTLGDALFTRTQQKVLGLLYGRPDQSYFTNEIVRWAALGTGSVVRELERLVAAGLLRRTGKGNQNHYQANPDCPIYEEVIGIVRKTFGIGDVIKAALIPLQARIDAAFIYGSIAKGQATATSDIDLMLIGNDLAYGEIMELLAPAETRLARTINPTVYTRQDFQTKLANGNHFLQRVLGQTRITLWGENVVAANHAATPSPQGEDP